MTYIKKQIKLTHQTLTDSVFEKLIAKNEQRVEEKEVIL